MSAPHVLAVNAGSSSLKLALFTLAQAEPRLLLRIGLDRRDGGAAPRVSGDPALAAALSLPATRDYAAFTTGVLAALTARTPLAAVVHRVVHGGDETRECIVLDAASRARLHALSPLAPLHQPPALAIIDAIAAAQPALPQYAGLDTAFHAGLPPVSRDYALPADVRARHPELHACGFHGLSCRWTVQQLARRGALPERLVIAHLGSGASATAVRNGTSIATTMGFSALEGLPMATRPGRLDAGVLLHLLRHERLDVNALEEMLYRRSGLLGLSGLSADVRVLLASSDPHATAALDYFVERTAREIGGLAVALGGIDTLVYTGGIGEHQGELCARITGRLRCLLPQLAVEVVPCDEEAVMAAAVADMPAFGARAGR